MRVLKDDGASLWTVDDLNDDHEKDDSCEEEDPRFEKLIFWDDVNLNCYDNFPKQCHKIANDFMCLLDCEECRTETGFDHLCSSDITENKLNNYKKG